MGNKPKKDSIGDRMKHNYENVYNDIRLPRRMPVVLRLDGRAFHTLTKKSKKPFDKDFIILMQKTAKYLCQNIQGAQVAYVQSDEISILLHNYKRLESEAWYDNKLQKIVSVAAGMASSYFTVELYKHNLRFSYQNLEMYNKDKDKYIIKPQQFDCRAFVLPEQEVNNYFVWRQQDWERNSKQMLAQSLFSQKELQNKNTKALVEMCDKEGVSWDDMENHLKYGTCIVKKFVPADGVQEPETGFPEDWESFWAKDENIPKFKDSPEYIEKYITVEE